MTTLPLRRLARIINGGTPSPDEDNWDGSVPWATPVDLAKVNGRRLSATDRNLTERGLETGSTLAPSGSVLLSTRAPIGYTAVIDSPSAFNQGCKAVAPITGSDARYLQLALIGQSQTLKALGSGSTFLELSNEALASLPIPAHSHTEQRRIVDFLDDRIARIDRIIAARQQQLRGFHASFVSARRDSLAAGSPPIASDLPWAPRLPPCCPVRRLQHVARMGTGHTPSRSNDEYWVDCTIPWLTTADVHKFRADEIDVLVETEFKISEVGLANSAAILHPAGTVALSRTASAGFSILMGRDMATSQDFVTWTCGPALVPEYLLQVLRVMRPYLLGYLSMGSTHKTIYFPDLMDLRVPVPSVDDQQAAVERVRVAQETRSQLAHSLTAQVDLLQEYKQSLITAAVTGELDVTTASTKIPE